MVINYDLPLKYAAEYIRGREPEPDCEVYLHRVGRAGRFGRKGKFLKLPSVWCYVVIISYYIIVSSEFPVNIVFSLFKPNIMYFSHALSIYYEFIIKRIIKCWPQIFCWCYFHQRNSVVATMFHWLKNRCFFHYSKLTSIISSFLYMWNVNVKVYKICLFL